MSLNSEQKRIKVEPSQLRNLDFNVLNQKRFETLLRPKQV